MSTGALQWLPGRGPENVRPPLDMIKLSSQGFGHFDGQLLPPPPDPGRPSLRYPASAAIPPPPYHHHHPVIHFQNEIGNKSATLGRPRRSDSAGK